MPGFVQGAVLVSLSASFGLSAASLPNAVVDENRTGTKETAVFAGGCFWGVEAVFDAVKRVSDAVSGYAGGSKANAYYEMVSTGTVEAKMFRRPIVTKVAPLQAFYRAEDYHQDFVARNPTQGCVAHNDLPKLIALRKEFPELVKRRKR